MDQGSQVQFQSSARTVVVAWFPALIGAHAEGHQSDVSFSHLFLSPTFFHLL